MSEYEMLAIALGLVVSLLFSELFGLAAGGMVVPGYIALHLKQPLSVLLTVGAGLATFAIVHSLASIVIVYGRRRTVLMILVGFLIGEIFRAATTGSFALADTPSNFAVIGLIIPGLIATWVDRQGVVETVSTLITASVVVRVLLIFFLGSELA